MSGNGKTNAAMSGAATGASVGGPWGAAIGGVAGYMMGADDNSDEHLKRTLAMAEGIPLPVLKQYYPDIYQTVVSLNPELETAVNLGPSAMEGVSTDPALKQAQMKALLQMQEVAENGGMNFTDKAALNNIQNEVNTNLQGQQGAIMQNLATRGMSGGGSELVQRQMAAQGASNQQADMALNVKAQAERRALEAMMQSGQLAGQQQGQDFAQQSNIAQAKDAINQFNTANQQQVMTNNTSAKNNSQQWNAQNAQSTANSNTQNANAARQQNLTLEQQQYQNRLAKLGITATANQNLATNSAAQAAAQNQFLGSAISAGATAYGANQKKKDQ